MILSKGEKTVKTIKLLFNKYKFSILPLTGIVILIDTFFLKFTSSFLILLVVGLWVLNIWLYKFEGRVSIGLALGFLTLCPFLLIFKKNLIAEKAAVWVYMFLVVGVIQLFIENFKKEKESVRKED